MTSSGTRGFVARFAKISEERIARGRAATTASGADLEEVARELHSMAGEAGLLGVREVMALARAAEQAVLELSATRSDEGREAVRCALGDLEIALRNSLGPGKR